MHDIEMHEVSDKFAACCVRRHINWNNLRPDLKEDLAHLVQDIRRRVCGIAIAVSPSF